MKNINSFCLFLLILIIVYPLHAQSSNNAAKEPSFSSDFMMEIDAARDKILALAEAFPQDKYGWRPSDEVRSVSEVFMHVAGANYFLLSFAGEKLPDGFKPDMEKTVTKKEDVIKFVKDSYENLKNYMSALDIKTLDDQLKYFGTTGSKRHLLFILLDHNHEHLGQAIAYARMNGITPPWSVKQ